MKIDDLDEGIMKGLKRSLQGWNFGPADNKPKDVVNRNKGYDTDTLKGLQGADDEKVGSPHSPRALQKRVVDRELRKREQEVGEAFGRRDAYQRDYDSSVAGMGKRDSYAYQMDGGANDEGWDKEEPQHQHRSYRAPAADVPHDVHIDGRRWKTFGSHSHASNVARKLQSTGKNATVHRALEESAGDTNAASIGTVDAPQISPGKARGKKSYIGSPGQSGTKAPPQPKVVQPKGPGGVAKNGLDVQGASLFGGPSIKRR